MEIGQRIHVLGNSCAGKSTLAARLSDKLGLPIVELDELNWQPNWVGLNTVDPDGFRARIRDATAGDAWILAGSYESFAREVCWDRLQTVIWLDRPMLLLLWRVLRRSWKRWRTQEDLWGTGNTERFWPQLAVWRGEQSLVYWIVTQHRKKRARQRSLARDPSYAYLQIVRLTRDREIDAFVETVRTKPTSEDAL